MEKQVLIIVKDSDENMVATSNPSGSLALGFTPGHLKRIVVLIQPWLGYNLRLGWEM